MKPLLILGLAAALIGCGTTLRASDDAAFEARHARRVARNPLGVSITLDTADGKRTYAESEYIPLVLRYFSSIPGKYKLEAARGWINGAAESQRVHTGEMTPVTYPGMIACCGSDLKPLTSTPKSVTLSMQLRLKPGRHELYVSALQVFPWSTTGGSEHGKALATTSSRLSLDITPDPGWQKRELAKIRQKYAARKPVSCWELSALDAPEATAEKLKEIETNGECYVGFLPAEDELAEGTIEQWIHDPNHGVTKPEELALASMKIGAAHPELSDEPVGLEEEKDYVRISREVSANIHTALVNEMCAALPAKSAAALAATKKTICEIVNTEPVKNTTCGCQTDGSGP